MSSKLLLTVNSILLGVAGLAGIFAPAELLSSLGLADIAPPVLVQLLGALYFSFAITNWTARHNPIGGIYSRPIALGNFANFMIGTLVLIRPAIALPRAALIIVCAIYLVFALLFGALLFGQGPVGKSSATK